MKLDQAVEIDCDDEEGEVDVDVDVRELHKVRVACSVRQRMLQITKEFDLSNEFVFTCLQPHIEGGLNDLYDLLDEAEDMEDIYDLMFSWQEIVYNPSNVGGDEN